MESVDPRRFGLERIDRGVHMLGQDAALGGVHHGLHALELVGQLTVQLLLVFELACVLVEQVLQHPHFCHGQQGGLGMLQTT